MSINNDEELQKFVNRKISFQIIKCKETGTYSQERFYDAQWRIIDYAVRRAIRNGENSLNIIETWNEIKETHRSDFIKRLKASHKEQDERNKGWSR